MNLQPETILIGISLIVLTPVLFLTARKIYRAVTDRCPYCGCEGGAPHTFSCPEITEETDAVVLYRHMVIRIAYEQDHNILNKMSPQEIIDEYEGRP